MRFGSRTRLLLICLLLATGGAALGVEPDEIMADPAKEARARAISAELRCLVCQNQSIDDSEAPLARDLRVLIRERLRAGDDDRQIQDFLVSRYGEFVLLRPTLSARTALLWLGPCVVLACAVLGLVAASRRSRAPEPPLSAEERSRLIGLGAAPETPTPRLPSGQG